VEAICPEDQVPPQYASAIEANARFYREGPGAAGGRHG
jgi:hypothetical protein